MNLFSLFTRPYLRVLPALALSAAAGCVNNPGTIRGSTEAEAPRRLTLLHLADTHAQLETHPEYLPDSPDEMPMMGGFARLKTAIERVKATSEVPVFTADSGDTFQGSPAAAWSQGEAIVKPLNALELDVFVPGNWEPVYGAAQFRKLMGALTADVLAYNFHDAETGERLFAPAKILERDGVRVAFVGIADPTTSIRQPPAQVRGLDTTRMDGLRAFVRELEARERPDLVVAVTHTGLTISRQIAREVPELDVILSGHTHERTEGVLREGNVVIVEPGSMGSFLGRLDVTVAPQGGIADAKFELMPIFATDYPEHPGVQAEVVRALAPFRERMDRVLGETRTPILRYDVLETSADNLVADAVREISGADIGSTNGFRFTPPILPGKVTVGSMWNLLPLDSRMKMGEVTGAQLRAYLERELELVFSSDPWKLSGGWGPRLSGVELEFAALAPPGKRIRSLKVNGKAVTDDARYTIAGCEREGEVVDTICRMTGVKEAKVLPLTIHQALEQYFARHPVVAPERQRRAVAVDLPSTVFSQDAVLQGTR